MQKLARSSWGHVVQEWKIYKYIKLVTTHIKATQMTSQVGPPAAAVVDTDSVENENKESRYVRWSHAVQDYVSVDLFRYVQFINREEDVMFGSGIQRIVCHVWQWHTKDSVQSLSYSRE